jgi:lipopolysaccharide export system permease protein
MNKVLFRYLLSGYFKTIFKVILITYCFGIIFNLFEEIEFFKNLNVTILKPLVFTSLFIPTMIIKLMPFIIFVSGMWFLFNLRNSSDLLTLKVYGYSNFKIFFILAFTSFILGWLILIILSPVTSQMSKYYEKTKSNYSRDIDHLITFNKNGLWIKEKISSNKFRIINADKPENYKLINVKIFHLNEKSNLLEKIISKNAEIKTNNWILRDVRLFKPINGILVEEKFKNYEIESIYNYEKINSLFKNFNTMSFLDLVTQYDNLKKNGYSEPFLNESLHSMLVLPFFLFLMTALAAVLTMNTLKKSDNFKFIIVGILTSVLVFYFKDLSLALGKTGRISLIFSVWVPVIALSFFIFIGVIQINEK